VNNSDNIKTKGYKYRDEFCQMLIDHLKEGRTIDTFGATVGVVRSTIYEWIGSIQEFKEAFDIGCQLAQEWHEVRLNAKISGKPIPGIDSKKIDTTALIFALKTRFHKTYGDKSEVQSSGEIKIVLPDLRANDL
jgi:hypothetical protein